jgi:hypothetical protein
VEETLQRVSVPGCWMKEEEEEKKVLSCQLYILLIKRNQMNRR